jgi:selenide,water dikinase
MLVLTKPIGTGILSTALKKRMLSKVDEKNLIETMAELNKSAAEAMQIVSVNACTDITGFGLLGHLLEMMNASNTSAVIEFNKIKFLNNTFGLAMSGNIPGGTKDNFAFTNLYVTYDEKLSEIKKLMLNDAQTSGGLLISVPESKVQQLYNLLDEKKVSSFFTLGKVISSEKFRIKII